MGPILYILWSLISVNIIIRILLVWIQYFCPMLVLPEHLFSGPQFKKKYLRLRILLTSMVTQINVCEINDVTKSQEFSPTYQVLGPDVVLCFLKVGGGEQVHKSLLCCLIFLIFCSQVFVFYSVYIEYWW